MTGGLSPARTITYAQAAPSGSGTVGDIVYTSDPASGKYIGWVFTPAGWKRFGLVSTERDLDTWVIGDANNNGRLGIGTDLADRAGVNDDFRGALDVRGQIVADKLLMTGISTFQGTTIFEDVEIERLKTTGSLDVTGITTFSDYVVIGAGVTANQISVSGISTFTGSGTQVVMQFKADKTATPSNVSHATSPAFITITNHGFLSGEKVQYVAGSTAIGGLTNNRSYFVIRRDANSIKLATTASNAASDTSINLSSAGAGTHTFKLLDRSADSGAASLPEGVGLTVDKLHVVGIATFPADLTVTNVNLSQISVSGLSTFNGALDINATSEFSQPVTLNGTLNANAAVNLGDDPSVDTITATGRFDSSLIPTPDNSRDLGAVSLEWRDLFLDGTAHIDTLDVDENAGITGTLTVGSHTNLNSNVNLGNANDDNITFVGRINSNLIPDADGTYDLGSSTIEWRDIFIDGTAHIDTLDVDGNAGVIGQLTVTGLLDANGGAHIDNLRLGIDADNDITTSSGNLTLDSASGTVRVNDNLTVDGTINGNGSGLTTLNASNISSGTISDARLPATITSDITGNAASADTVDIADQTSTNATRYLTFTNTDGAAKALAIDDNLSYNPSTNTLSVGNFSGNISGANIVSGTVPVSRIPNLDASKITSGTFATARIPNLNASKINAGTLSADRIPNLNASKITAGTISVSRIGTGTKNSGTFYAGDGAFRTVTVAINSLSNAGNNRIITSSGGTSANSETNLTFNGSTLAVTGSQTVSSNLTVSGAISCAGNITAFTSDIRLKTEIQPIENAVAKLLKLNGFTYEHNELAESLGYERNGERFSGVSAQDVKEVLPEAVKPAPANADYMTVQYEKLVPLLIEAIKELKSEIDELKK